MEGLYSSNRQRLEMVRSELIQARSSIEPDWQDVANFISPHRLELVTSDGADFARRNQNIIDASTSHARTILEAGMTTSICSPARAWFRLMPPDADLSEWGPVKDWLHAVQDVMLGAFAKSSYYSTVPTLFGDSSTFGIGAKSIEEDFETIINTMTFPVGSYCGAVDHRGRLRVFTRDRAMTVRQVIELFGRYDEKTGRPKWEAFAPSTKSAWDRGNYHQFVEVRHVIEPNMKYMPGAFFSKDKRFCSYYWEVTQPDEKIFLREKGYDHMPVLAAGWSDAGMNFYSKDCPGFRSIGDTMQLQKGEELGLGALELQVKPPMTAHPDIAHSSQVPGGVTITESPENFKPLFQNVTNIQQLEMKQEAVRRRAEKYYHMDLFQRVLNDERRQRATAEELIQGKEEKFMILQPVLTMMDRGLNNPALDIVFMMCLRQRRLPPPPKELEGQPLRIEYINLMTQAMKMQGIAIQDRFLSFAERLIKISPQSEHKFDFDQMADEYGNALGVNPRTIRPDDRVEEIRSGLAKAAQTQAQGEAMVAGTQAVKNLAQADTSGENALTELMNRAGSGVP